MEAENTLVEKDLVLTMEEHHELTLRLLPSIRIHLRTAERLESERAKEVQELIASFREFESIITDHLNREMKLLLPLLDKLAQVKEVKEDAALVIREIEKVMEEHAKMLYSAYMIDSEVKRIRSGTITSHSLRTACEELTGLTAMLREHVAAENRLFPAVLSELCENGSKDFYITNINRIMKNILLPIDMRPESDYAIRYAVELARSSGASITLCHTYQLPVPPSEIPVIVMPVEEVREQNEEALRIHAMGLKKKYPGVNFECMVKAGNVEQGVADAASELSPDLIVMGLSENDAGHFIFGHNASGVVNSTKVPVLMLPPGAEYKPLRRIVLACDFQTLSKDIMKPLHKLLRIFNPELMIVHVVEEEGQLPTVSEAIEGLRLDHVFAGYRHSFHFPVSEDVVPGINEFAGKNNADLVVTVHHPRGFIKRLFSTVHTRQMSFSTNLPLLVLQG